VIFYNKQLTLWYPRKEKWLFPLSNIT